MWTDQKYEFNWKGLRTASLILAVKNNDLLCLSNSQVVLWKRLSICAFWRSSSQKTFWNFKVCIIFPSLLATSYYEQNKNVWIFANFKTLLSHCIIFVDCPVFIFCNYVVRFEVVTALPLMERLSEKYLDNVLDLTQMEVHYKTIKSYRALLHWSSQAEEGVWKKEVGVSEMFL